MKRRLILLSVIVAVALANVAIFKVINNNRTSSHTSFSLFSEALAQSEGGEDDEREVLFLCPDDEHYYVVCAIGTTICSVRVCP